ncbi:ankyrin repeat domain-containing protein 42-like, partial [Penaeus japonicus]|uniref:ankyrin repeat domain-containing protein 42-like n=1 Tax=Penaeus japonicus TaxID=27405 RepID=UPI001C70DA78
MLEEFNVVGSESVLRSFCEVFITHSTSVGQTAMHLAARYRHTAVLEVLREGGADVDTADGEGNTPLHKAASRGHLLAIFMLTKFGASTYKKNKSGRTPQDLMPRSSSTESRGMELFQSVSMTHVAQGWVATEKERISLQREIQVLKKQREQEISAKNSETVNLQKETRDLKEDLRKKEEEIVLLKEQHTADVGNATNRSEGEDAKDRLEEGARKIRELRAEVREMEEQLTQAEVTFPLEVKRKYKYTGIEVTPGQREMQD